MSDRDVFPSTIRTWIGAQLRAGAPGRAEINHHVMSVYALPLEVYFRGAREQRLGEAADVVHGFFADRLARESFFTDWEESGMPLRRWLMNAFAYYLKEERRALSRRSREQVLLEDAHEISDDVAREVDRAFAVSLVTNALADAEARCAADGLTAHWELFRSHHRDGLSYRELCSGRELDPVRAATMVRTAARKFRNALRELLSRDGTSEAALNDELTALLETTGGD